MCKVELLSPGGNLRKVKTALLYGADAVYVGTPDMSLRSKSEFSLEDLCEVARICRLNKKKFYLTLNLFSHNKDIEKLPHFVKTITDIKPDGVLIADPAIFMYCKTHIPDINLHVSTQANVCSWLSVDYWQKQGANLCVLAREVSFHELAEIREKCPNIKLEAFIHGSMCMTYSGRCLLSNFMAERGANQGSCAHSCRWQYKVKAKLKTDKVFELNINENNKDLFEFYLEEEYREGEMFALEEDEMGSYILNSKDLCLMPVLPDYLKLGVDTLKIEGRNKSEYYVALVTRAYRLAIDNWYKDPDNWSAKDYMEDLNAISSRGYTTAFHDGRLTNLSQNYDIAKTLSAYQFAGIIDSYEGEFLILEIKNMLNKGDILEFISPYLLEPIRLRLYEFIDYGYNRVLEKVSPGRAGQKIKIPLSAFHNENAERLQELLPPLTIVRKEHFDFRYDLFLQQNKVAFKVETKEANSKVLENIKNKIANNTLREPVVNKEISHNCCSKGCNGCLAFWNDEKYAKLREKLKDKKLGEMLIKSIDF